MEESCLTFSHCITLGVWQLAAQARTCNYSMQNQDLRDRQDDCENKIQWIWKTRFCFIQVSGSDIAVYQDRIV
jgi:hypothetical protein